MLASDHEELDELLAELFSSFEAGRVEQIYQRLDMFWARLAMHIRAEHLHLFPAILNDFKIRKQINRRLPSQKTVRGKITALQKDHNFFMSELLSAIKQIRKLLRENNRQDISKALAEVREVIVAVKIRLETHNELEESEVYEWADAVFDGTALWDLNEKMCKELNNLPLRFEKTEKRN